MDRVSAILELQLEIWVALAALVLLVVLGKVFRRKKRNLPPGPIGLPIIGYFPFLTRLPHLKFIEISKKYGDVFSIYLGSRLVVILNSAETARDAFAKRELLARPPASPFDLFGLQTPFFSPNFEMWQEQRRFVVHSMKDLGLGKSKIEVHLQEEILYFMSILKSSNGKPINLLKPLTPSMSNNICALVFGERYKYGDHNRIMMDTALNSVTKVIGLTQSYLFFPWLRSIPMFNRLMGYEKAVTMFEWMKNYMEERIQTHEETLDPKNIRDFIDSYLLEMKQRRASNVETTLSEETMKGSVMNLFGAGSETVRTSISWCIYVVASFPDVQEKVQKEIMDVVGSSRLPEYPDSQNMPYTNAVIREIMRWKTILPLNIFRYTLEDTQLSGYDVPKGTIVTANFWAVHHDPRCWKDPDAFLPDRFLDENGKILKNNNFMPFSVGKRSCPGENMAQMEIFLYFTSILQRFRVSFPSGYTPDFEAEMGLTYRLKPHEICFTSR